MTYNNSSTMLSADILQNICSTLSCEVGDITDIEPLKVGLTNISFSFMTPTGKFVYRSPGKGTDFFINRKSEAFSESVAKEIGLDNSIIFIDPEQGWKISRYIENFRYINPLDGQDQADAMELLRRLHNCGVVSPWDFDYGKETERILSLPDFVSGVDFSPYLETHLQMQQLSKKLDKDQHRKVLCHNDSWHWNMLKAPDGNITLLDWEYSGNSYPEADVAYFTASLPFSDDDYLSLAELYEKHSLNSDEKRNYFSVMAIVLWYWFVWALYEEYIGTPVSDKELWRKKAVHAMEKSLSV